MIYVKCLDVGIVFSFGSISLIDQGLVLPVNRLGNRLVRDDIPLTNKKYFFFWPLVGP